MSSSTFELAVFPPFRLDLTVWALRRRATNNVDLWSVNHYSRIIVFDNDTIKIDISQKNKGDGPILQVTLNGQADIDDETVESVSSLVKTMLGLTVDMRPFYALAEKSDVLGPLVRDYLGVKPPRFPTLFEALVNAIACQQVSLDAAIQILDRFSERFGMKFENGAVTSHAFPRPEDLMTVSEEDIRGVGLSRRKARSIKEIAKDAQIHEAALAGADQMTNAELVSYLSAVQGIGRWSAEYVLLRGLGRLDTFPGDDVGAKNNLQRLFHLDEKPDYNQIKELMSQWQPYQGLVYFHLLLNKLQMRGLL